MNIQVKYFFISDHKVKVLCLSIDLVSKLILEHMAGEILVILLSFSLISKVIINIHEYGH